MKVLIPLPRTDFDPTESGVPWKTLKSAGVTCVFSTPDGLPGRCDPRMLGGKGLGPLATILAADHRGREAYAEMAASPEFQSPLRWSTVKAEAFDGLILPGGHAAGMREYLESMELQAVVRTFFGGAKPVGAICHGVVLAARSRSASGQSVLYGRKTTALLASQELVAWGLTRVWLGDYYRTYKQTVESEVRANLADPTDFLKGPMPLFRDRPGNLGSGFTVTDANYISSRWPGDAHAFAAGFLRLLK